MTTANIISDKERLVLIRLLGRIDNLLEKNKETKWLNSQEVVKQYMVKVSKLKKDKFMFMPDHINKDVKPTLYLRKRLDQLYRRKI